MLFKAINDLVDGWRLIIVLIEKINAKFVWYSVITFLNWLINDICDKSGEVWAEVSFLSLDFFENVLFFQVGGVFGLIDPFQLEVNRVKPDCKVAVFGVILV